MPDFKFTTKALVQEALLRPGVENRQNAYNVIMDTYEAAKRYLKENYETGNGILIPGIGAFYFENGLHKEKILKDHAVRKPRFVFLDCFLTRCNLKAPVDQQPTSMDKTLGSLFTTNGPMFRMNWTTIAGHCGYTPQDCKEAWDRLVDELVRALLSGKDGTIDLGVGTFHSDNYKCALKLKRDVVSDLEALGTLTNVKTAQAMATLGTFRPSESFPKGTTIVKK